MKTALVWTPARVGCHWHSGEFSISTVVTGGDYTFPASYYELKRNREEIGQYATLGEAQRAAEEAL